MPSSRSLTRKLLLSRQQWNSNSRRSFFAFGCFLLGMAAFGLSIYIIWGPTPAYKCDKAEGRLSSFIAEGIGRQPAQYRPKVLGLVGIQTGFECAGRRRALRETWLPSDPGGLLRLEQARGLAFRFVIGRTDDAHKMGELEREEEKYSDFMRIDIKEEYNNLPYKTLEFFKSAFNLFDADFYVKIDDDIYLRPDRLAALLGKERSSPRTYIGCMKKGPVFTDPNLKWHEPLAYMLGKEYFIHAYGPIYALSAEVVASLSMLRNDSFRMFSNEDVTIGAWMLAMNVDHEDNQALCSPKCTPTSIAVWDIPRCAGLCDPAVKLKELHDIGLCSKNPTLAPDKFQG